ncbi:MAG: TonB-dependent receptor [Ignavibacteriota bacterium]
MDSHRQADFLGILHARVAHALGRGGRLLSIESHRVFKWHTRVRPLQRQSALRSGKAQRLEAGYRQILRKNLYVDIAGFFNHYHDLFSEDVTGGETLQTTLPFPAPTPPPTYILLPAQFQNDLYGATYGGEIAPEWRPSHFWRLRGSYSFLRMSLKTAPTASIPLGPGLDQGSSPQHEVSIDSGFDLSRKLQLDLIYRFVSRLPYQNVNAYSTGDVRFGYRLTRNLELSVVGQNLFQSSHVEYVDDPGGPVSIRRSAYASLAWIMK